MLITVLILLLGAFTSAYAECDVTPDFLPYGGTTGDTMYPMQSIPFDLETLGGLPYNAFGFSGTGWQVQYSSYWNYVRVGAITVGLGSVSIEMRPRERESTSASNRLGAFFWRHSTDVDDLQRVNQVLCGPYDGVLVVTFECYADNAQSTQSSIQIWVAYTGENMVVVFVYDDPLDPSEGFIRDATNFNSYPMSEPDNLDDYITATDVTLTPTVESGQRLPTLPTTCPPPPCCGADLTGCGPIARPDPRCDPMTCAWGSVSHTYSCPDERTCDMNCFGCDIAPQTLTCSEALATMSCSREPEKVSTCSKTAGVGIIFFKYMCEDASSVLCHELCCCEKNPNGGIGISDAIHCTSPGVLNKGFGDGAAQDKRAYCPGYEIPEWN